MTVKWDPRLAAKLSFGGACAFFVLVTLLDLWNHQWRQVGIDLFVIAMNVLGMWFQDMVHNYFTRKMDILAVRKAQAELELKAVQFHYSRMTGEPLTDHTTH